MVVKNDRQNEYLLALQALSAHKKNNIYVDSATLMNVRRILQSLADIQKKKKKKKTFDQPIELASVERAHNPARPGDLQGLHQS